MSSSDEENDNNIDSLLEAEAEAAALRRAIAEGSIPGVSLKDLEAEDDSDGSRSSYEKRKTHPAAPNSKALQIKIKALTREKNTLAWQETLEIVADQALTDEKLCTAADVHDDLKREVAFYDMALNAVNEARVRFKETKVPFSRPTDFYADMVKTDEHMAKVKDRLLFESKKIEAFEKRKSNKEYKLRAKEARENKLMAKHKAKKDHMKAVSDWAKNAAENRVSGRVGDDDDEQYLSNMYSSGRKKQGRGEKRMRYRPNDKRAMNDMSQFNPRGNFSGGTKSSKKGNGTKRAGKRARDAARSRRN